MALRQRKKININLVVPFLVIVLVFSVMIWQKYRNSHSVPDTPPSQQQLTGMRTVTLFFVANGTSLEREAREVDACGTPEACLKDLLDELVAGPVGELDEALPEGTTINSVSFDGELVTVDLSRSFLDGLPSGSSAEMLAVFSLVDTVAFNFQNIKKVKISIDGDPKNMLRHLDISEPLVADYDIGGPSQPDAVKTPDHVSSPPNKGTR
ncbi:MAG TPA: GerMN domain-containing protein [Desulfuromonadales bacterium]|nr:GerMN domain-containing protein [Desulfuromonadales bacterium]